MWTLVSLTLCYPVLHLHASVGPPTFSALVCHLGFRLCPVTQPFDALQEVGSEAPLALCCEQAPGHQLRAVHRAQKLALPTRPTCLQFPHIQPAPGGGGGPVAALLPSGSVTLRARCLLRARVLVSLLGLA